MLRLRIWLSDFREVTRGRGWAEEGSINGIGATVSSMANAAAILAGDLCLSNAETIAEHGNASWS
jgi:hypothetical protein